MVETFRLDRVSCRRGGRLVFAGLSLTVAPGEALILRGPNGSGKSSLLRLCAGLITPAAGALYRGAKPIAAELDVHRADLHYVGHLVALKPILTLAENLELWARLYEAADPGAQVRAALGRLRLGALADLPARVLSSGQGRRAALARLLLKPAPLWLLDEPTVGLDRESMADLTALMAEHLAGGGQIIAATHQDLALPAARTLDLAAFAPGAEDDLDEDWL